MSSFIISVMAPQDKLGRDEEVIAANDQQKRDGSQ
jgi:hypothetical protein